MKYYKVVSIGDEGDINRYGFFMPRIKAQTGFIKDRDETFSVMDGLKKRFPAMTFKVRQFDVVNMEGHEPEVLSCEYIERMKPML